VSGVAPSATEAPSGHGLNLRVISVVPEYRYRNEALYRRIGTMARQSTLSLQVRFGQRINRLRKSRGWSFTYLSIHSGIAKSTLQEIEKGRSDSRINTIDALAGSFSITLSELFKGL